MHTAADPDPSGAGIEHVDGFIVRRWAADAWTLCVRNLKESGRMGTVHEMNCVNDESGPISYVRRTEKRHQSTAIASTPGRAAGQQITTLA